VVAQDPVTFRTIRFPVYTVAAFTAITGATTIAVSVPGLATTVNYNVIQKLDERQQIARTSRNLADHP
jgi:hypothetical protein